MTYLREVLLTVVFLHVKELRGQFLISHDSGGLRSMDGDHSLVIAEVDMR